MRQPILHVLLLAGAAAAAAEEPRRSPDRLWIEVPATLAPEESLMTAEPGAEGAARKMPPGARLVVLDGERLEAILAQADLQAHRAEATPGAAEISIPLPGGGDYARFRIEPSEILAPELARKFPEIKTYHGQGIDHPTATVQIEHSPSGFHAQVLFPGRAVVVDPYRLDRKLYASFERRGSRAPGRFRCDVRRRPAGGRAGAAAEARPRGSGGLRRYRLAMAATGEYGAKHGGTVPGALRGIVTTVSRVSGIYTRELGIGLQLVADNDKLVFTDPLHDPFTNDTPAQLITESQDTIDRIVGDRRYDIGHTLGTAGGGLADEGACRSGAKARGVSGTDDPSGDRFDVDYVAHEIGHQLGADHTFNGARGHCKDFREEQTAFEPGSGSTILAYPGSCECDDLQQGSDPYFHSASLEQILRYVSSGGGGCGTPESNGNHPPVVSAGGDRFIPRETPFKLTAEGSDPDGDTLTFCWEQRDQGVQAPLGSPDDGEIPLFRSLVPTEEHSRTFPRLADVVSRVQSPGESLPRKSRTMSFLVTARDNRESGGAVAFDDLRLTVHEAAGPFEVTAPAGGSVTAGPVRVTWDVAGTRHPPVDSQAVNILLSTDGGSRFVPLLSNTPNDGEEEVTLPATESTCSHVMVESADNVFFAVSPRFELTKPPAPAEAARLEGSRERP